MKLQLILLDDLFYRGTGPKGERGEIGPTGPQGNMGPTSYSTIGFIRYASTTESTDASIYTYRIIPGTANIIQIKNNKDITINNTGLFEITVCGRISGVTTETGGLMHINIDKRPCFLWLGQMSQD